MNKTYIQGSLFLRKGPKPVSRETIENLKNLTYQLHGEETYINEGTMDWSYVDELHQLIINEKGMFLRRRDLFGQYSKELIPVTEEELENDYIDFMEYLKTANYIGKLGIRTKETKDGDRSYMSEPLLVLYQSPTHTITYRNLSFFESNENAVPIKILNAKYCSDWKFYGEQKDLYKNPTTLYLELLKESINKNNKNNKNNKRK